MEDELEVLEAWFNQIVVSSVEELHPSTQRGRNALIGKFLG